MDEDGTGVGEEASSLLESAARFEELVGFVAELYVDAEGVVGLDEIDDLLGKMVYVDYYFVYTNFPKPLDEDLKERLATDGNHSLRHGVGERFESRAETGSKDERVQES